MADIILYTCTHWPPADPPREPGPESLEDFLNTEAAPGRRWRSGHDGIDLDAPNTIAAMPGIVSFMNAHKLGATAKVPANATGGDLTSTSTRNNSGTG